MAKTEQICLKVSKAMLSKLREMQVHETLKAGRAVSIPKIIIKLLEETPVERPSEWKKLVAALTTMQTNQPMVMTEKDLVKNVRKVRNLQRSDYLHPHDIDVRNRLPTSINTFNEQD